MPTNPKRSQYSINPVVITMQLSRGSFSAGISPQIYFIRLSITEITIKMKFIFNYNNNVIARKINLILNLKTYPV